MILYTAISHHTILYDIKICFILLIVLHHVIFMRYHCMLCNTYEMTYFLRDIHVYIYIPLSAT